LFNKLTPLPDGELRNRVEALAGKLGFPLKHLYVIDGSKRSSHSNA
jgi:STE24 endopeptidase